MFILCLYYVINTILYLFIKSDSMTIITTIILFISVIITIK